MSPLSKAKHSRNQWKHKARRRADDNRYLRKQLARVTQERARAQQALKDTQARLRQVEAQKPVQGKVDWVFLALQLFLVARLGFRAVSRVLSLLAEPLSIPKAPCPQTIINWVTRLSQVRMASLSEPRSSGLIWIIDISIALGQGKLLAVLALNARHHQLHPTAPDLHRVRLLAVSVSASWTGETIADLLKRLIAVVGRPLAYLKDGGHDLQKAIKVLDEQGLASPTIDDISHAIANLLKRHYHDHPLLATFLSACGCVSGRLKQTLLACLTPPNVHTKARFMNLHRLVSWAQRLLKLSPPGRAAQDSTLAQLRACLDRLPACKAFIQRFHADATPLLACQKLLKNRGLGHDTQAACLRLIETIPSAVVRREFADYLHQQLQTATRLGLESVGLPISSDPIESLFGLAKQHGVGEVKDANRIALRLPALCGTPTRAEAQQVLAIRVAQQTELTGQLLSLTKQRREVLSHHGDLETLNSEQTKGYVEFLPGTKNRPNCRETLTLSTDYEKM
jgi:hypothetical protein